MSLEERSNKTNTLQKLFTNRNVLAWLLLVTALALHVLDEAMSDFLPFYNQSVINLREQLGFFPAPTFSFSIWLGGLIIAIILLYLMTYIVVRGSRFIRVFTIIFAVLMIFNGLGHLLGSLYYGRILPGMWSSPFLILMASFVVFQGLKGEWNS